MSSPVPSVMSPPRQAPMFVKLIVSLIVLFHLSAILSHVLSGGGPFVMRVLSSYYRPYLKTMWLDNAYRFYAPDPGPTEVIWYHLQYNDGSTRWTQVPRREDFYFRMPFQRHMSIALLGSMMNEQQPVAAKDDPASVASMLVNNRPVMRTVLTPVGEVFFRSYARHVARMEMKHPVTQAELISLDCYLIKYLIRSPFDMRSNIDMYDPRMLNIQFVATFSPDGVLSNFQEGFKEKVADDLFIEMMQNEVLPLLEENNKLPLEKRKPIIQVLKDYGIPYPLIQPLAKLTTEQQEKFFQRPYDRDTLRERYAAIVKMNDRIPLKLFDAAMWIYPPIPLKFDVSRIKPNEKPKSKQGDTAVDKSKL